MDCIEIMRDGQRRPHERTLVGEVPVALEYNGLAYAVMMATPTDLADFARGFALTERLARSAEDVAAIDVAQVPAGWIVRTRIAGLDPDRLEARVRRRVAESSCGLCGIESLEALGEPLPPAPLVEAPDPAALFAAMGGLRAHQPLGRATGAAHVAAFADRAGAILCAREDVGRHNALDKLIGALALAGRDPSEGLFLSSARCSYEIVEKVARIGGAVLATISAPTSLAVERAAAARLHLFALVRDDSLLAMTSPA